MSSFSTALKQNVSTIFIEYHVIEHVPIKTLIGNVFVDSHLHSQFDIPNLLKFRFNLISVTTTKINGVPDIDGNRNLFALEPVSGILRTARNLDRESLCPPSAKQCLVYLDIYVTPIEFFRIIRVRLIIDDVNDNPPVFDPTHIELLIYESTAIGMRFPLPVAFDADAGAFSVREYRLKSTDGVSTHPFRLLVMNTTEGDDLYLLLVGRLDRETTSSYSLTLVAKDGGIPTFFGSLSISISVSDANDNIPFFDQPVYEIALPEDTPVGTTVIKVTAYDADVEDNSRLVYTLMTSRGSIRQSKFVIDADTGHVTLVSSLDREVITEFVLSVMATDNPSKGLPLSGYSRLVVKVTDVNDNPPTIIVHSVTSDGILQVSENSPIGTFVAHISTGDLDEGVNGLVACRLTFGITEFELLHFGDLEYELVSARQLDREIQEEYQMVVTCTVIMI